MGYIFLNMMSQVQGATNSLFVLNFKTLEITELRMDDPNILKFEDNNLLDHRVLSNSNPICYSYIWKVSINSCLFFLLFILWTCRLVRFLEVNGDK